MNVKSFVPLVAGLCIGGVALKIGISTLQRAKGSTSATVELWAPAQDIPRGSRITADMLKPLQFPKELVPAGAVRDKDKLVGRVPHVDVPAGLPILGPTLLPPGSPAGVHVPAGLRAVAVKVDEGSGVDFHLEPGSRVDVIGYFQTQQGNKRETIARTLIEDVEVAAVGARVSAVAEEEGHGRGRPARAVTLLVKPDNVPILHLAEQRGKIKLSMRGNEDDAKVGPTPAVSDSELLGESPDSAAAEKKEQEKPGPLAGWLNRFFARSPAETKAAATAAQEPPAAPQPPANPPWIVQIYRGNQVETVEFQSRDSRQRVQVQPNLAGIAVSCRTPGVAPRPAQPRQVVAAPSGAAAATASERPGAEPNVHTEPETNAQDQVPQEPSE